MRAPYLKYGIPIIALILLSLLPHLLDRYWVHIAIYTLWFIYLCSAWDISAQTRMYSLAHTVFLGAGAYTAAMLFLNQGLSPWLGMGLGILIAIGFALIMGGLGFRFNLSPLSFALMTLAFAFIAEQIAMYAPALKREWGFIIYFTTDDPLNFLWLSKTPYYYIILIMTLGTLAINYWILKSKTGLCFRSIRDNERVAAAVGVNIMRYKMLAFLLSALLTAPAGTFWAFYSGLTNPETVLSVYFIIQVILYTAIGGVGTLWGPVVVASFFVPFGEFLRGELGARFAGGSLILIGVLVILVLSFMPHGIIPWWRERQYWRREAKAVSQGKEGT